MNTAGIAWKAKGEGGKQISHRRDELRNGTVIKSLQGYQVRLVLTNTAQLKFDGFTREVTLTLVASTSTKRVHEQSIVVLKKFFKDAYDKVLEEREFSNKGINWGDLDVKGCFLFIYLLC